MQRDMSEPSPDALLRAREPSGCSGRSDLTSKAPPGTPEASMAHSSEGDTRWRPLEDALLDDAPARGDPMTRLGLF